MKNKIKIFIDCHVFDGEFQGSRTYLEEIYLCLLKTERKIDFYFGSHNINSTKSIFGKYSNAFFIKYNSNSRFFRIFFEIPKIIKKLQCTHAHFQYIVPFSKKCKYIVSMHDILFNDFPEEFPFWYSIQRNLLFKISAHRTDYLLTLSKYSKDRISKRYNISKKSIILAPCGVSDDYFNFSSHKQESRQIILEKYNVKKYILYVSRIEPRKNHSFVIDLFNKLLLREKGYHLLFVGKESIKSNLKIDTKKSIIWLEQVDYDDLLHLYNGAEMFIYPSKAEGFGIPPLEAASLLTPVMCSNKTAMKEFDFFKPFMFDPDDLESSATIMRNLLYKHDFERLNFIKNAIKQKYSWEVAADKIRNILFSNN